MVPDRELDPKERKCPECGGSLEDRDICSHDGNEVEDCNICPLLGECDGIKNRVCCVRCEWWEAI